LASGSRSAGNAIPNAQLQSGVVEAMERASRGIRNVTGHGRVSPSALAIKR